MKKIFSLIKEYWYTISQTYLDKGGNTIEFIEEVSDNYELQRKGGYWSCFICSEFIFSLYGGDANKDQRLISNLGDFTSIFRSGNVYHFYILNHSFTIIYENKDEIYYCDYYMETGRGDRQIGEQRPRAFRFERKRREQIERYVKSYLDKDYDYQCLFHSGDLYYYEDYKKDFEEHKNNMDIVGMYITRQPILRDPTVHDLLNLIKKGKNLLLDIIDEEGDELKRDSYLSQLSYFKDICDNY